MLTINTMSLYHHNLVAMRRRVVTPCQPK